MIPLQIVEAASDGVSTQFLQNVITSILAGGLVAGLFSLITKKSKSPESQNELARLGNDFAAQLLKEATEERKELRATIASLEALVETKKNTLKEKEDYIDTLEESIETLKGILRSKDDRIIELEGRQQQLAEKLQHGEKISLTDIFGDKAPDVHIVVDSVA